MTLVTGIDAFLKSTKMERHDLGAVAVNCGPGSFTGLRVGIATGKSLAFALKIPTVAIDTLESILAVWNRSPSDVAGVLCVKVVVNAYRQQLFVRDWVRAEDGLAWTANGPSQLIDEAAWIQSLESVQPETARLIGPDMVRLADRLPAIWLPASEEIRPDGQAVAWLGYQQWELGNILDAWSLMPNYLRRSAAEEKR